MESIAPLTVIVGETASGKTALAIELAQHFDGEIICADSRTVYKGMDIGTAKPTKAEQKRVKHHLIDVVDPDTRFTAVDFKQRANQAITDIRNQGKLPIMVGGTGLYIDAILYDYQFSDPAVVALRDPVNPRHLLKGANIQSKRTLRANTLVMGLQLDREVLRKRIIRRIDIMVEQGLEDEVRRLGETYGWDVAALQATGYKAFHEYIDGSISLEEAKERFVKNDMNLAKRQRTWFRRNKSIQWITKQSEAVDIATTFLNKIQ